MKNADLRQLALLCELIDTQSLNEAAARLHMTASAASHALGRLREVLGDEVCVRDQQRYQLTPFGEAALEPFRQILSLWREASETPRLFEPRDCEARLVMSCHDGFGLSGLAEFYRGTLALAPQLRLDIASPANGPQDIEDLRSGAVDVVCSHHEAPADARDLHMETLRHFQVSVCCLRQDHPRIGDRLSLAQYLAESHLTIAFLQRPGVQRSAIDQSLQALGLPVRRSSAVPSWALCAELLSRTDHLVSTSPEQAEILMRAAPGLRCLALPADLCWPRVAVHMIWHHRTHQSKPHRWLRQRLREHTAGG